ncbi:hypothetical protein IHE45_04G091700 [Dioscorea alata]|uniref:Uncharacterized protein n=1 Tax=Dioscorea alata TaxID=55571 RepID=A0ACB7WEK4_DIOAL|nr:hypothetical protein IHE45_04G091700 [Dioscorea alata]
MIFLCHHLPEGLKIEYLTKYFELTSCLLMAEQNNELLMKNHEFRLTGSTPIPEVNVTTHNNYNYGQTLLRGRGCGHSLGHGYGRGNNRWKIRKRKMKRKRVGKLVIMWIIHTIVVVPKVIGLVPVVHQNILLIFTKNHSKTKRKRSRQIFFYKDDIDYEYIDDTHLDIVKEKIDHLIGDGK